MIHIHRSLLIIFFYFIWLGRQANEQLRVSPPPPLPTSGSCSLAYNVLTNGGLTIGRFYQRTGDVFVSCTGLGEVQLTHFGDVLFFAFFEHGTKLAVVRKISVHSRMMQVLNVDGMNPALTQMIPDGTLAQLTSTCGSGLLFEHKERIEEVTATNLADMLPIRIGQAREIRCSADKSLTVEILPNATVGLVTGSQSEAPLATEVETYRANPTEIAQFDLSPDGKVLAYVTGTDLCIIGTSPKDKLPRRCTDLVWPAGRLIVSDAGTVLFSAQTDQSCPVGATAIHHAWPCEGIFSWDSGHKNTRLVRFLAVDPQILAVSDAGMIFSLATRRK